MSRRTSKIVIAVVLAFAAPMTSACTIPLVIDCGPGLTCTG
ncbi:putative membrane protein [Mycobacterium intracellulare 1956]|uniref:Putative membrane protein n=1 Tax=Mycobacterium intracellulare 1956 TaxID=1299331 RepID=X8CCH5_MYCIT|nr:putative membrane protein [Mycobacterium intracellulare]EUA53501.1 putative membrane protein [Mycobacterium intracellulare 1956]